MYDYNCYKNIQNKKIDLTCLDYIHVRNYNKSKIRNNRITVTRT